MTPTTEREHEAQRAAADFYDTLASEYDAMTGFQKRFVHEKPFFRLLVERYGIRSALDAGCGTGFHSLLLAQLGVEVTAIDLSSAMLTRLKDHAKELGLSVTGMQTDFLNLRNVLTRRFDAVFSTGNSLAHLLTEESLRLALGNFHHVLTPGGILFVQVLNYDRILSKKERVQSVKEAGGKTFLRFYDYGEKSLTFNILTIDRSGDSLQSKLQSVELNPLRSADLSSMILGSGFTEIKLFGSIALDEFCPESSKDLVIFAKKTDEGIA